MGHFLLKTRRKIGKSIVLSSTKIAFLYYNKSYESSASKFAGFRSTFAAYKSENDQ